jgi:hypothetical protein
MAIVHSVLGTNLAMARASPCGAFVKTSTGHVGWSQPESFTFGSKNSLNKAVSNWRSGSKESSSPCQTGL